MLPWTFFWQGQPVPMRPVSRLGPVLRPISLKKGGKSWGLMTCLFSGKDQPRWDQQGAEGGRSASSEKRVGQLCDSARPLLFLVAQRLDLVSVIPFFFFFSNFCSIFCSHYKISACLLCLYAQLLSGVRLFATPWTIAHRAPMSMGFSRKNIGVGCYFLLRIFPVQKFQTPHRHAG